MLTQMLKKATIGSYLAECPIGPRSWKHSSPLRSFGVWLRSPQVPHTHDARWMQQDSRFHGPPTLPFEFLQQLDIFGKTGLPVRSGNSTLFWADRADRVVSVEDEEHSSTSLRARVPAIVPFCRRPTCATMSMPSAGIRRE